MKRTPLSIGSTIQAKGGSSYTYIIDRVIGDGASSIVYEAHYIDSAYGRHDVRLKECYPYASDIQRIETELVWANAETATNDKIAFTTAYHKLLDFQNTTKLRNSTAHIFDLCEANGTLYSVMDVNEGQTFEQDKSEKLSDILKTTLALARVVEKYHNNGYLHLDIKPSNFLVIPETRELVILFDVDSVTSMEDIASGKVKCASYSKGWAAPEQMQGRIDKLCPATDVYSIGAILFQKIMGRAVENEDIGIFANWDFNGELFDDINPAIKRLLREIFKNTLAANIKRRYQVVQELVVALVEAIKAAEQEQYMESDFPILDVKFVGREKELTDISNKFDKGAKAVFLHAFGGVGKTTLVKKYAQQHEKDYDVILFKEYEQGLAQIIDGIYVYNESTDDKKEHRNTLKTLFSKGKTLLIIDNFDVEDDDDLTYILSLNCDIIFTTRNDYSQYYSSEKIDILELDYLAVEDLVQVFKNEYGKPITESEEDIVGDVIERFGYVTKIVPIIAKQIIASHITIEAFSERITDDVFAAFDEENEDIRITANGKPIRTNSLVYIRAAFNIANLSNEYVTALRYLYMLRHHESLTFTEYKRITGEKKLDVLNQLIFLNWVSVEKYEDEDENESIVQVEEIRVHQLVYDLIAKDFMPTYENVPGIVSYIDSQFHCVSEFTCEHSGKDTVNFEEISSFVYALQLYTQIVDKDENWSEKAITLTLFLFTFFDHRSTLKGFLFDSPDESAVELTVEQVFDIMAGFTPLSFSFKEIEIALSKNDVEENDKELMVKFLNDKIKNHNILLRCCLLRMYFDYNSEVRQDYIYELKRLEELCNLDSLESRISDYIAISDAPLFDEKGTIVCESPWGYSNVISVDSNLGVEFNCFVISLIQRYLLSSCSEENRGCYLKELEKLVIVMNEHNSLFAFYGIDERALVNYNYQKIVEEASWSKKAKRWYDSFTEVAQKAEDVFSVYKLLLTWDYIDSKPKSIVRRILNANFVKLINSDDRLTEIEKDQLMFYHAAQQLYNHMHNIPKYKSKPGKTNRYAGLIELYVSLINQRKDAMHALLMAVPSKEKNRMLETLALVKRIVNVDIPDIYDPIEKDIESLDASTFDLVLESIDIVRRYRNAQKAKRLRRKVLDRCMELDCFSAESETSAYLAYKVNNLAKTCEADDVIHIIEERIQKSSQGFYIELLDYDFVSEDDKERIATNFLDSFIDHVSLFVYADIHEEMGEIPEYELLKMAEVFKKNCAKIFAAIKDENCWYTNVFEREKPENSVMGLIPYWLGQFYEPKDKRVALGICYMIAQKYDTSIEAHPMSAMIEYIFCNDNFALTVEELVVFKHNLNQISELALSDFMCCVDEFEKICLESNGQIGTIHIDDFPEFIEELRCLLKSYN